MNSNLGTSDNLSDHGTLLLFTLSLYEKNSGDIMMTSVDLSILLSVYNGISSYTVAWFQPNLLHSFPICYAFAVSLQFGAGFEGSFAVYLLVC